MVLKQRITSSYGLEIVRNMRKIKLIFLPQTFRASMPTNNQKYYIFSGSATAQTYS